MDLSTNFWSSLLLSFFYWIWWQVSCKVKLYLNLFCRKMKIFEKFYNHKSKYRYSCSSLHKKKVSVSLINDKQSV